MCAKLYHDLLALSSNDTKYSESDEFNGSHLSSNSTTPFQTPQKGRDRSDSESHRAGNALLGLSGASMLPPPMRERDQSLFNLPDDLPQFQRASTTEIFETLNVNGLGPSALVFFLV